LIDYLKLGAETTYSDELDLEDSDFETSLFPMQCYGNFEKSKKIVVKVRVDTGLGFLMVSSLSLQPFHHICI